jgi:hypothetical protein
MRRPRAVRRAAAPRRTPRARPRRVAGVRRGCRTACSSSSAGRRCSAAGAAWPTGGGSSAATSRAYVRDFCCWSSGSGEPRRRATRALTCAVYRGQLPAAHPPQDDQQDDDREKPADAAHVLRA